VVVVSHQAVGIDFDLVGLLVASQSRIKELTEFAGVSLNQRRLAIVREVIKTTSFGNSGLITPATILLLVRKITTL